MSLGPLLTEVIVTFVVAASLLYKYGDWFKHHVIVTISVLIAWYFSFLIIFVLPLDVASTVFRQCIHETIDGNVTILENLIPSGGVIDSNITPPINHTCEQPWGSVPEGVFPNLWRVVYWTSQCLTWLILPVMQSYTQAGDFTVSGKLKAALVDNAIYYGSYLFIAGILLIYLAVKPGLDLDGQKLKAIASSASNTWGLTLLVLLLGYALVEVPRSIWNSSRNEYMLRYAYFKAAKLSTEHSEAEDTVEDVIESLQGACACIGPYHPLYPCLETILNKLPPSLRERVGRRGPQQEGREERGSWEGGGRRNVRKSLRVTAVDDDSAPGAVPSEKALVRLHRQVIKALQTQHRTEAQWMMQVERVVKLEDVAQNLAAGYSLNGGRNFVHSFDPGYPLPIRLIYTPKVEWYWECVMKAKFRKLLAIIAGLLSAAVVWSEVTFFNKDPPLSLFAIFLNVAKEEYDYLSIEIISTLVIAYLCFCAYSTLFKIRVLNFYYLAPHHQTDEHSLIFSGMMLCRLTPPMCLNFLGLIHMDSHIIKRRFSETQYTQVMGHMDVISIVSDGFNIYFPMGIVALCLATYFSLGSRLLTLLGFQQFMEGNAGSDGDDDLTAELVDEGRELVRREKRRRQRTEDTVSRRREFGERFGASGGLPPGPASRYRLAKQKPEDRVRPIRREDSTESARAVLLQDVEPVDYVSGGTFGLRGAVGEPGAEGAEAPSARGGPRSWGLYQQMEAEGVDDDSIQTMGGRGGLRSARGLFDDV
ncbi:LMBR1 domain-containing protein 2 homolog [Ischnura elegans]|uniref:LMBR1 domain-containing protein 2 homolog n=1 Tax=Ischnura elegans TaxID=197161 RepID=UPI001ED892E1|nr:LMBR1 domain-containing protein 2 homolog [Ischnura elegans]